VRVVRCTHDVVLKVPPSFTCASQRQRDPTQESAEHIACDAVDAYVASAVAQRKAYEVTFEEKRLGFTVALSRRRPDAPGRRGRAWCTLTVEDVLLPEANKWKLHPTDELVKVNGKCVAIRDDDDVDDLDRILAFDEMRRAVEEGPRPIRVTFVHGQRRKQAMLELVVRHGMAKHDKSHYVSALADRGLALRQQIDALDAYHPDSPIVARRLTRVARLRVIECRTQHRHSLAPHEALLAARATDAYVTAKRASIDLLRQKHTSTQNLPPTPIAFSPRAPACEKGAPPACEKGARSNSSPSSVASSPPPSARTARVPSQREFFASPRSVATTPTQITVSSAATTKKGHFAAAKKKIDDDVDDGVRDDEQSRDRFFDPQQARKAKSPVEAPEEADGESEDDAPLEADDDDDEDARTENDDDADYEDAVEDEHELEAVAPEDDEENLEEIGSTQLEDERDDDDDDYFFGDDDDDDALEDDDDDVRGPVKRLQSLPTIDEDDEEPTLDDDEEEVADEEGQDVAEEVIAEEEDEDVPVKERALTQAEFPAEVEASLASPTAWSDVLTSEALTMEDVAEPAAREIVLTQVTTGASKTTFFAAASETALRPLRGMSLDSISPTMTLSRSPSGGLFEQKATPPPAVKRASAPTPLASTPPPLASATKSAAVFFAKHLPKEPRRSSEPVVLRRPSEADDSPSTASDDDHGRRRHHRRRYLKQRAKADDWESSTPEEALARIRAQHKKLVREVSMETQVAAMRAELLAARLETYALQMAEREARSSGRHKLRSSSSSSDALLHDDDDDAGPSASAHKIYYRAM